MFQIERLALMLEYIDEQGRASVSELAEKFGISKVTVRSDINELMRSGSVIKTHGGVVSMRESFSTEIPSAAKRKLHVKEKKMVGKYAASLVEDGDVVILDAGSTTAEVGRHIEAHGITVLTNDIAIGYEIGSHPRDWKLVMAGGVMTEMVYTLCGEETVAFFKSIRAHKLFLGVDALDAAFGISNRTLGEVAVKRQMIQSADRVIAVTDSSKLGKRVFAKVCELSMLDILIVDTIEEPLRQEMEERGVQVLIPSVSYGQRT